MSQAFLVRLLLYPRHMVNLEPIPNYIIEATYRLIQRFIERRLETVVTALVELRPDLFILIDLSAFAQYDQQTIVDNSKIVQQKIGDGIYQWTGIWNHEWGYRIHGDGCELTHLDTNERYDWDVGDPLIFFTGQFYLFLKWLKLSSPDDADITIYSDWEAKSSLDLAVLLGHLCKKELLATRYAHEWELKLLSESSV